MLSLKTASEVAQDVAGRVRELRLARGWTQAELAEHAGVSPATYVLFERTGRIALLRLIRVFAALGIQNEIEALAATDALRLRSIDTLTAPKRVRGRRRTP